jgi:hypothetical protein
MMSSPAKLGRRKSKSNKNSEPKPYLLFDIFRTRSMKINKPAKIRVNVLLRNFSRARKSKSKSEENKILNTRRS